MALLFRASAMASTAARILSLWLSDVASLSYRGEAQIATVSMSDEVARYVTDVELGSGAQRRIIGLL